MGLKAKIDVTQAEVAVITAQSALLQAENDVRVAWVTLAAAMGLDSSAGGYSEGRPGNQPGELEIGGFKKRGRGKGPCFKPIAGDHCFLGGPGPRGQKRQLADPGRYGQLWV